MDANTIFEGNPKFVAKAPEALRWLVKYAQAKHTVRYGELGKAMGVHPRTELPHILGIVGNALKKYDPALPMLQLIVINQKGVVGDLGLTWIVPKERIPLLTREEKLLLCEGAQTRVFKWNNWGEVLASFHLNPLSLGDSLDTLVKQISALPRGGEGEDHRVLKEYVKDHPYSIGLKQKFTCSSIEHMLLSGDEMDVFFESPTELVCIEVKGKKSPEADFLRGIFQCVKYRAVLEGERLYRKDSKEVVISVVLVLAVKLPEKLKLVSKLLNIPVVENVSVPESFVASSKN